MPTKRPARKSSARRNPSRRPVLSGEDLADAKRRLPRGTILYGILRSHAASGTRTIELVYSTGKNKIARVWPSLGIAAGLRYNMKSDGYVFTGGGYSAMLEAAAAVSRAIYGTTTALKYENSYL